MIKLSSIIFISALATAASANNMYKNQSAADVEATRLIRQEITGDNSLSVDAKNVKIITNNDQIVLRGSVDNATEKAKIASIAKDFAKDRKVKDEMEVVQNQP